MMLFTMGWASVDIAAPWFANALVAGALVAGVALSFWLAHSTLEYWQGRAINSLWHGLFAAAVAMFCFSAAPIAVATLSYHVIERPFLRLGRPKSEHPGLETPLPPAH